MNRPETVRYARLGEALGRAHYHACRQEISLPTHNDICWLADEVKRLAAALEEIKYGLWGDMPPHSIIASMKTIARRALDSPYGDERGQDYPVLPG